MDSNKSRSESLDTQLKIVAATFGDILSGEQLEEISRYVDENGMLRCYDKNDFFFIERNGDNTEIEVTILNALGQSVYQNKSYLNNWSGDALPAGTYYYVVTFTSSGKIVKGALYLKR